jgi:hypothetical protein
MSSHIDSRVVNQPRSQRESLRAGRRRPRPLYLLRFAAVVVAAAFVLSLVGLAVYAPNGADDAALDGPALAAGVLGIYAAVAGQVLGFVAAARSGST